MSSPARMGARGSWTMASNRKRAPAQRREERATSSPIGQAMSGLVFVLGVVIGLFVVVVGLVVVVEVDEEAAAEEGIEEAEADVKVMVAMKRKDSTKEMCQGVNMLLGACLLWWEGAVGWVGVDGL